MSTTEYKGVTVYKIMHAWFLSIKVLIANQEWINNFKCTYLSKIHVFSLNNGYGIKILHIKMHK